MESIIPSRVERRNTLQAPAFQSTTPTWKSLHAGESPSQTWSSRISAVPALGANPSAYADPVAIKVRPLIPFLERNHASPAGGQFHAFLQEATDEVPTALHASQIIAQVLGMDNAVGEEVQVHVLVELLQRVDLIPALAILRDEFLLASSKVLGCQMRMMVFIGWSMDTQSTPIHLISIRSHQLEKSDDGPGCLTM